MKKNLLVAEVSVGCCGNLMDKKPPIGSSVELAIPHPYREGLDFTYAEQMLWRRKESVLCVHRSLGEKV